MQILTDLVEFAKEGKAAKQAAETLIKLIKVCPYCGRQFIPQTHNHKYCTYDCRWENAAELRHIKRQKQKGNK